MRVRELAALLGAEFEGDGEHEITGVAPIDAAASSDLSFVGSRKAFISAQESAAGCLIVPDDYPNSSSARTIIRSPNPRAAFASAVSRLLPATLPEPGVHPTACVGAGANVDASCSIGPYACLGDGVEVGPNTAIAAGCVIGKGVIIGANCRLYPNVSIYPNVSVGDRVVLHSGCVVGADGFGFVLAGDHYDKFPQVGRVVIENDVEIGANSCIDRAAIGVTHIGQGTKLDNMVHIGHNCRIGKHVVIAAQTGLSGGVEIGDYAVVGGQVGIGDKARIEPRTILGSGSGVLTSKIVRAGEPLWGTPARPLKRHLEQLANITRLPQLRAEVEELKRRLLELEAARR